MEPARDSEVVGVDILQYPVESEVSDVTAPSPSAIPLPSFGCQVIDMLTFPQDLAEGSSGRDISGLDIPGPATTGPDDSKALRHSSSARENTSEAPSEDSDMSVGQPAAPKRQTRTPKGSVGKALQGAVELFDSAMQIDASSADDTSDVSVLSDMADQAVFLATSRQTGLTAPTTQVLAPPPPPPPPPPASTGIGCTPTARPRYAGDALLTTSGQDLHTELVLSRVVGGAVSVT